MEHQSINRPDVLPEDAREYLTEQPEPVQLRLGGAAIDAVRAAGWWNYDRE